MRIIIAALLVLGLGVTSVGAQDSRPTPKTAETAGAPVNLNTATLAQLEALPGIGPALARRIVAARDADGRFARIDELGRVRGMSQRKIEQLRTFITVE